MGAVSQEQWLAFVASCRQEFDAAVATYGEPANAVLSALSSARGSTPQSVIESARATINTLAAAGGPAGEVAGQILGWLIDFGEWLVGAWPAVPDYNNTDAAERVAEALGFPGNPGGVLTMAQAGWIAGQATLPVSARKPDDTSTFDSRATIAWLLCPTLDNTGVGGVKIPSDQSWEVGLARADAVLAGGARVLSYRSNVSRRQTYGALAIKVQSLPDDLKAAMKLYVPLVLTLQPMAVPERWPSWMPQNDRGLARLVRMAHGADWLDAPVQRAAGSPMLAKSIADAVARAAGVSRFRQAPMGAPVGQPRGGAAVPILVAALAGFMLL